MNMNKQTKIKVTNKWYGDFSTIYSIRNLENEELEPVLLFYNNESVPKFIHGQEMTIEEVENTRPYKMILFNSWDDIPNDMAMALGF
jgi:hypothetical protein